VGDKEFNQFRHQFLLKKITTKGIKLVEEVKN
jgi:hypothetical protein